MTVYYANLLLILALAWPLCIRKPSKGKKIAYIAITMGYMWFLATFRYGIGYDYYTMIDIFRTVQNTQSLGEILALQWEPGYLILTKLMSFFIHDSITMYGVYQVAILLPIAWFIYRHCENAWLATWLYVTLTFYYTTLNFTRQSIACSLVVLAYGALKNRKPIPYFILILLAGSFHKTALIMIPLYFLANIRPNKKWNAAYAVFVALGFLFIQYIWDFVTQYVYEYYRDSIWAAGFPPQFLFVPFVVFGACVAMWFAGWPQRYKEARILLNLMMYSATVWLFITRMFILERLSMYVYIFVMLALPQAISCLKCSPEEYEQLAQLEEKQKTAQHGKKQKALPKSELASEKALRQKISDHRKYYWSAVVAVLLLTAVYHEFGSNVNQFHGVFPYHSEIQILDAPGLHEDIPVPDGWVDMR